MKRKVVEKLQAIELRKDGHTINEITQHLKVSKGSVSAWVRNVPLSKTGEKRLTEKIKIGQFAGAKSRHDHTLKLEKQHFDNSYRTITQLSLTPDHIRLLCALMYWCEGAKGKDRVDFTNSDPNLVQLFLKYLRVGFALEEHKFRVNIQLHTYHNANKQIAYWSRITAIPEKQFNKPYQKTHTSIQIREDYQGCISIRYHDADVARHLHALAKATFALNK
jgi:hypothetical protein